MGLRTSLVALRDPTVTLTVGSSITFVNDGKGLPGINLLEDLAVDNPLLRQRIRTKIVRPAMPATVNALAKLGRAQVTVYTPFTDSKGKIYDLPDEFFISYHPESTVAQITSKIKFGASLLANASMTNFWTKNVND